MEVPTTTEKPLNPGAKALLMLGAAATIFLFYTLTLVAITFLLVLLLMLLCVFLVALRFGAVGLVMPMLTRQTELLQVFWYSFWLRDNAIEFRLPLTEEDAPELFDTVQVLSNKLDIAPPQVVQLEMGLTAWVRLKGLRQGKGETILGVGYDLLAGLSKAEMEGVLAHEMTHAKLIQRGLKGWLTAGLSRLIRLTNMLDAQAEPFRRENKKFFVAELYHTVSDWLTRLAAKQISAYSRQDEFEADHGAAELCGAAKIRSSLMKLDQLEEITSRLPWKERVARLQLEGGYSRWLRAELAKADFLSKRHHVEVRSPYSTHPTISDRLAALPDDGSTLPSVMEPAIDLLANPDQVADQLVVNIQKKQAEAEEVDSKALKKWSRKVQGGGHMSAVQGIGLFFYMIAGALCFALLFDEFRGLALYLAIVIFAGFGYLFFWLGRYKDKLPLQVPEYTAFIQGWRRLGDIKDFEGEQKRIEQDMLKLSGVESKKKKRAKILAQEAYDALSRADYLSAHVAARLGLKESEKSAELVMAYGIASAALNMSEQAGWALARTKELTGLKSPDTILGAGWTLLLLTDWAHAEAFLDQALAKRPLNPSWRMLLALAQARRGKLQNAIKNAREACELKPDDDEAVKLFIDLLLEGGYFREAQEQLAALDHRAKEDVDLIFAHVKVQLIQQNVEKANEWAEQLKEKAPHAQMMVRLGESYEEARQHEYAMGCYNRALEKGFYPEAYVGLGRMETFRQNHDVARSYFLSALEISRPLGEKAVGPFGVFHEVVGRLVHMHDPVHDCRAWVVSLTGSATPKELAHQAFLVYANDQAAAERHFDLLMEALRKGLPPLVPGSVVWRQATKQQQPEGPVRPGVQGLLN
ncbi:MAG TPA: M48 family metalloprotease [Verrucomicrobiae bacterium]